MYRNSMCNFEKLCDEDMQSNGIFEIGFYCVAALEVHKIVFSVSMICNRNIIVANENIQCTVASAICKGNA